MVRCCRTPAVARELFSANALSGWAFDNIAYTPRKIKRKKRERRSLEDERIQVQVTRVATPVEVGIRLA